MPLYEYRCQRCGQTFEVQQKFADKPLTQHEECGGEVDRLVSAPSLRFKGSGWYVNDYPSNGKPAATNGSSSSSESKGEAKAEAKAETKSESKPAPAKDVKARPENQPAHKRD